MKHEKQRPRSLKELSHDALNYEYSNTVPVKVYLRTAETLSRHADLYRLEHHYEDAFVLYTRYLDLVTNKLPRHPQIKQERSKQAHLVSKAHHIIERAENIKTILKSEIEKYDYYQKQVDAQKAEKAQEEKQKHHVIDTFDRFHEHQEASQKNSGDSLFETALAKLRPRHSQTILAPSYPSIPSLHKYTPLPQLSYKNSPPPVLPPKDHPTTATISPDPSPPVLPPKHIETPSPKPILQHKSIASLESGKHLKPVYAPESIQSTFLEYAMPNSKKNLETCAILCGRLSLNAFFITTLVIPEQESTPNTCQTTNEESLFEYIDTHDLFVLGWIHTHPSQSCFLSSIDLHSQNSYQIMLPEAIAMVCAPSKEPNFGVYRLTDPPGIGIITKCQKSGFHPHEEGNIYRRCDKNHSGHVIFKKELVLDVKDLR